MKKISLILLLSFLLLGCAQADKKVFNELTVNEITKIEISYPQLFSADLVLTTQEDFVSLLTYLKNLVLVKTTEDPSQYYGNSFYQITISTKENLHYELTISGNRFFIVDGKTVFEIPYSQAIMSNVIIGNLYKAQIMENVKDISLILKGRVMTLREDDDNIQIDFNPYISSPTCNLEEIITLDISAAIIYNISGNSFLDITNEYNYVTIILKDRDSFIADFVFIDTLTLP